MINIGFLQNVRIHLSHQKNNALLKLQLQYYNCIKSSMAHLGFHMQ